MTCCSSVVVHCIPDRFCHGVRLALGILIWGVTATLPAQESAGFRELLQSRQRETLKLAAGYLDSHPDAADVEDARSWLLETSVLQSQEDEAFRIAEAVLKRGDLDPATRQLALQVVCVGAARKGDLTAAQAAFQPFVRGFRLQSPFKALDVASALSARAQLAGDRESLRGIYDTVAAAFALNPQAGEIVENRLARLELLGKDAPPLQATDVTGQPVAAADLKGKVVLVDFWATNCAPCLAEFPNLRRLYRQHQPAGFEVIGVSFDDSPQTVSAFAAQQKLPWRHLLESNGQGEITRSFQTRTIPALFLLDRRGKIAFVDVRGEDLREAITRLIAERP